MFSLNQATPVGEDCTSGFKVTFDDGLTVQKFIKEIFSQSQSEWGNIKILWDSHMVRMKGEIHKSVSIPYNDGSYSDDIPLHLLQYKVKSATAHGGYGRMDYEIVTEGKEEKVGNILGFSKEIFTSSVNYVYTDRGGGWGRKDVIIVVLKNTEVYLLTHSAYVLETLNKVDLYGKFIGNVSEEDIGLPIPTKLKLISLGFDGGNQKVMQIVGDRLVSCIENGDMAMAPIENRDEYEILIKKIEKLKYEDYKTSREEG